MSGSIVLSCFCSFLINQLTQMAKLCRSGGVGFPLRTSFVFSAQLTDLFHAVFGYNPPKLQPTHTVSVTSTWYKPPVGKMLLSLLCVSVPSNILYFLHSVAIIMMLVSVLSWFKIHVFSILSIFLPPSPPLLLFSSCEQ